MLAVRSYKIKMKRLEISENMAYKLTAEEMQMSPSSVRNHVKNYVEKGVAGLYDKPRPGRPHIYDRKIIKKAVENIKKGGGRVTPRKLTNEIARLDKSKQKMSDRQALRILHGMGLTPKKAESANVASAKPHEVYYWRRVTLPQILALRRAGYTVTIVDEMVVYQDANGKAIYWSPPGETVKVPYVGDHDKCTALGLTTEPDKNGIARHCNVMAKKGNTKSFIELLEKAVKMFGLIVVITDRASWHMSDALKNYLDKMQNMIIIYHLPKASPYMSLQEANWRQTKLSEYYQEYYSNIEKKKKKTQWYLDNKLNPHLDLWKYLLRSPYAHRRNIKRRKNRHRKEGALQYIIRKYNELEVPKLSKKYAPLFADPARRQ